MHHILCNFTWLFPGANKQGKVQPPAVRTRPLMRLLIGLPSSIHRWHVDFDAQRADGVLTKHRDVFQNFGIEPFLTFFGSVALSVPPVLLSVHLGEEVELDGAQRGRQHVEGSLHHVAEGWAQAERRAHQVGHRLAHHAHALQKVQRAFLHHGLVLVLEAFRGRGLLDMIDQEPRAVREVGGGAAQREEGQVQVTRGFGQSMEEQPQLQHGIAWS